MVYWEGLLIFIYYEFIEFIVGDFFFELFFDCIQFFVLRRLFQNFVECAVVFWSLYFNNFLFLGYFSVTSYWKLWKVVILLSFYFLSLF